MAITTVAAIWFLPFVLPICFGLMTDYVNIPSSAFMLMFLLVAVAFLWMHVSIRLMERRKFPEIVKPHFFTELEQPGPVLKVWKPEDEETFIIEENGETFIYLVFHDCIVRQTLRRNGLEQGGPLCQTLYGYVVGAIEEITGRKARLEIVHTGPNACLKKLILK